MKSQWKLLLSRKERAQSHQDNDTKTAHFISRFTPVVRGFPHEVVHAVYFLMSTLQTNRGDTLSKCPKFLHYYRKTSQGFP